MSTTLATCDQNVRYAIRDFRPGSNPLVDRDELRRAIVNKALELGVRAGLGEAWTPGALALSDTGSRDFTFSSAVIYAGVKDLRIATTGAPIFVVSREAVDNLWQYAADAVGTPTHAGLFESSTQVLTARLYPRPNLVLSVDALVSQLPATTLTDATVIPFSPLLASAVEKAVAIEMLAKLPQADDVPNVIEKSVMSVWAADVEQAVAQERNRQGRLIRPRGFLRTRVY